MAVPEVATPLRGLKLPGMAEMLNERFAQATARWLGHAERLALLCGDEIVRRDEVLAATDARVWRLRNGRKDHHWQDDVSRGADQHAAAAAVRTTAGELLPRFPDDLQVIGGGVRPGVPRAQQHRDGFPGAGRSVSTNASNG